MFATYFASVKKRWNAKCSFARGAIGQPHSGIRIEASLGKYVFGVFKTTSATCGELQTNRLSYSPRRGSVPNKMFATYFASVKKRWNAPCTVRCLQPAPPPAQNISDLFSTT